MRIDSAIITGSFSVNGDTFNDLGVFPSTGSNTFVGNQTIVGAVSASALTGSIDFTNLTNVPTLVSGSEQIVGMLSPLNSFSASNSTTNTFTSSATARLNSIETITSSNLARLNSLEIKTGSLATTGSNTFIGNQTISGTVYIQNDLIVQGSSSLQNITASAVSIGTNIVNLNTANPSIRYAGLSMVDSGSIGGSGSFLYDSVQDEMIFIHRGTSTVVTSSVTLMGPQTYDSIGNETYPTLNIIQKGTGNEHLIDSSIFDNGTTVCVNTTLKASGQVCGVMGTFSCAGIGTITPSNGKLEIQTNDNSSALWVQTGGTTSAYCIASFRTGTNAAALEIYGNGTSYFGGIATTNGLTILNGNQLRIYNTGNGDYGNATFNSTGGVTFDKSITADGICISNNKCAYFSGHVGIGIIPNGPGLRLATDTVLRVEGASSGEVTPDNFGISIGGRGSFRIDAPGIGAGRFNVTNAGTVGIGVVSPGYMLDINDCTAGSAGGRGMRLTVCSNSAGPQFRLEYQCTGDARNWLIGTNQEVAGDFIIRNSTIAGANPGGVNSITRFNISKDGTFGFNCLGVAARTMVVKGASGCYIVAEFIEPAGVHSIELYPNKNSTNHISSDYMSGGTYLPLSLSGRECSTDLLLGTNGRIGIGAGANKGILTVYDSGCTISSGDVTFATQAKGIELYNYNSGTTDNVIGLWFSTGPHKTGIASGRTNAAANWEVDLRFYVHPTDIANLDNAYERMRLYGGGNLTINGSLTQSGTLSDIRLKENIVKISNPLQKISCINGYTFEWKEGSPARRDFSNIINDAGLIAQEVESIMPDIVRENECTKALNYNGVVGLLVEGMKAQQCIINTLKTCIGIN